MARTSKIIHPFDAVIVFTSTLATCHVSLEKLIE